MFLLEIAVVLHMCYKRIQTLKLQYKLCELDSMNLCNNIKVGSSLFDKRKRNTWGIRLLTMKPSSIRNKSCRHFQVKRKFIYRNRNWTNVVSAKLSYHDIHCTSDRKERNYTINKKLNTLFDNNVRRSWRRLKIYFILLSAARSDDRNRCSKLPKFWPLVNWTQIFDDGICSHIWGMKKKFDR